MSIIHRRPDVFVTKNLLQGSKCHLRIITSPGRKRVPEIVKSQPGNLLSEPWADTATPAGKMIMAVFAGIAKIERELICGRTTAGRVAAKNRGVRFGRPRKLNAEQE
jgi:hypothetical protein